MKRFDPPVFDYLLVKVASRCNIFCDYCYWFRDDSVMSKPKRMTDDVRDKLFERLREHITEHRLDRFSILLHGGEPLLYGKENIRAFCEECRSVTRNLGCRIKLSMTTNGMLLDDEWIQILKEYNVSLTISIDGPKDVHDAHRVDAQGRGTFDRVVDAVRLCQQSDINLGILAVADPTRSPVEVCEFFVDQLKLPHFDILIPDATHDDDPVSIAAYFSELFDLWYDRYAKKGIRIRTPKSMLTGILGGNTRVESIGFGPIQTVTVLTDGSLEPLDVLRIAGDSSTATGINVFENKLQDLSQDPIWLKAFMESWNLNDACQDCEYRNACGGGFLPTRYSKDNGWKNPSVYCEDYKEIFDHIWNRVAQEHLVLISDNERVSAFELAG